MRSLIPLALFAACHAETAPPVARPMVLSPPPAPGSTPSSLEPTSVEPALVPVAAPVAPAARKPSPSTLPTFAKPGDLYLLTVDDTTPSCEAWSNDPSAHRLTNVLTRGTKTITRTVEYSLDGASLVQTFATRADPGPDGHPGDSISSVCNEKLEIRETEQTLLVSDGSTWFRTPEACAAAIQMHARVATAICTIPFDDVYEFKDHRPTRAKFDALLAAGGALYSRTGDACLAVRVIPSATRGQPLEGRFQWDEVREDGVKGHTSVGYSLARDQQTIWFTGPDTTYADGSGISLGCLDEGHVSAHDGFVQLDAPAYFTKQACTAAVKAEARRVSWFPAAESDIVVAGSRRPGVGGC